METNTQIVKSAEKNAIVCANFLKELTGAIEKVTPAFHQLFHDFSHLRKGQIIMGCRTQDEWARKYANKTAEALRLTLKRSSPESHKKKTPQNQVQIPTRSVVDAKPTFVGLAAGEIRMETVSVSQTEIQAA